MKKVVQREREHRSQNLSCTPILGIMALAGIRSEVAIDPL